MVLQTILEGLGLGVLLVLICAAGICKGAVGMAHLYSPAGMAVIAAVLARIMMFLMES
ncbi:MAG: hypothetical protein V8Q05_07555 [Lachnospiraceae bacterium]